MFQKLPGQLILTNYRLLFVAKIHMKYSKYLNNQPNFVKEYFNIPLGLINRCEK